MRRSLIQRVRERIEWVDRTARVPLSFRHRSGPTVLPLEADDVAIVCLVRDGAFYLPRFLEHHFALGVKHIVLVDNGSTDQTLDLAARDNRVTVVQSRLPARRYECDLRRYAVHRFVRHHWCLIIDADELFDYPHSDHVALSTLVRTLRERGDTAVISQMLDLFPRGSLLEPECIDPASFWKAHRFYDLENIVRHDYHSRSVPFYTSLESNEITSEAIKYHFGGIRRTVFGLNNCITKHGLIWVGDEVTPVTHPHCSSGVRCSDFTALIKHYKFAGDFFTKIRKQVANRTWEHGEDEAYLGKPAADVVLYQDDTSRELSCTQQLVEEGFLIDAPWLRHLASGR